MRTNRQINQSSLGFRAAVALRSAGLALALLVIGFSPVWAEGLPAGETVLRESPDQIQMLVSGRVLDENGEGLPGATILEKGTSNGALSGVGGSFQLEVAENATLVITYVGYVRQEIAVNGRSNIEVSMESDMVALEEVVVIGYGSVTRKDVTGAIGSINTSDITRANPTMAAKALQGQVAGVNVNRVNGRPGSDYTIDIRGLSSIDKSNEPLVVIDGAMGGSLNTLNPSDIASIDVLKDASATAIYGSRGANGVILVTTKKGVQGKTRVTYDGYVSTKMPAHLPDMMNAQQYNQAYNIDRVADGGNPIGKFTSMEAANVAAGNSTDWIDLVTDPGLQTSHVISLSGGNENTTHYFSAGYLKEEGTILHTDFQRFSLKGSMDSRLNEKVRVGFTSFYSYSDSDLGSLEALRNAYRARPTGTVYYDDLTNPAESADDNYNGYAVWMGINDKQVINPLVETEPENYQNQNLVSSLLANAYIEIMPVKGLSFKSSLSTSVLNSRAGEFRGTYTKSQKTTLMPRASYDTDQRTSYTLDNILTYRFNVSDHQFDITAVQSVLQQRLETSSISVQDLPYNSGWYSLGTAGTINSVGSRLEKQALLSYMGRLNYSFNDKYLLTFTGRWDGSSKLADGNKWAFFPSAAFSWRVIDEGFLQNSNLFSDLRLRLSYGQVGNDGVAPYGTQANLINTGYDFDGSPAFGFAPGNISNADLRWEKSQEINLGINMGFIQNRITASLELYKRNTVDLILNQRIPTSTGFDIVTANVGEVLNQGIELTLNTLNVKRGDFSWNTTINFSTNHNEILELYGDGVTEDKGNGLFVGESLNSNFYYEFDGIWQLDEADQASVYGQKPGSVKVVDQNGDGKISSSDGIDDRVVLGNTLPDWILGMRNQFTLKNWDLSFFVYTRQGVQFRNSMLSGTMGDLSSDRYNRLNLNYWTSTNPTNDYYGLAAPNPYRQAIQYQDASFVRISDITLGYTFPRTMLDRMGVSNVRLYGQVSNPFVFSNFDGLDPEYNSGTYQDDVPVAIYLMGASLSF